ncbi:MAG: hypothetical protein HUU01_10230 [Saprospiraceae bacterium]|nr:hypothetical protein [Saprospiraceae bacterium]
MKVYRFFFMLMLPGSLFTACSPTLSPFTQRLYDNYNWSDEDLKRIQFYVSDDIVMRRELGTGSTEITSGKVRVVNGRQVEEIVIRRGTPGILLFKPKENRFAVSFEDGGESRYLVFGPNPKASDRYVLLASEWRKRTGTVTYDGRKFDVDADDAFATLMLDMKKFNKLSVESRTAGGRKIN